MITARKLINDKRLVVTEMGQLKIVLNLQNTGIHNMSETKKGTQHVFSFW